MFSFFLRSKLVMTNLLQFIKFLSRTQSLFSKTKIGSWRREPSDYTMCAANQACISTHRQVVYTGQCNRRRTHPLSHHICGQRQSGQQQRPNGMANPTAVCKTRVIKVFPFAFTANVQGHTDKKRDCEFFRSLFLLIGMRVQIDWRTHRPHFRKNQSNTRMNPSAHNPPDTLPPSADFAPFSAAQFCFAELQTP